MQLRGGGLTTALVRDALGALSARYRTESLSFVRLSLESEEGSLTARVRDPRHSVRLDDYTFADGDLGVSSPVKVSAGADLNGLAFTSGDVTALNDVERLVDSALAKTHYEDGYVAAITVDRAVRGASGRKALTVKVAVTSSRSDAVVVFHADGRFIEVSQQ